MSLVERYGPTALVLGASEGIGAAFATQLAAAGMDLILVARRPEALEAFADTLRDSCSVTVRTEPMDLGQPGLEDRLEQRFGDDDIGLVVYNACHSVIGPFLDQSLEDKRTTLAVNVQGPLTVAHHFGPRLTARGRGGLLLMSSLSGFQGSALVGTYAGTKAFLTVLGESLWEEWSPQGVDVLVCAAGATLTPNFEAQTPETRRSSAFPLPPEQVAREALQRLGQGRPTWIPGAMNRVVHHTLKNLPRGRAVRFISGATRKLYGDRS